MSNKSSTIDVLVKISLIVNMSMMFIRQMREYFSIISHFLNYTLKYHAK